MSTHEVAKIEALVHFHFKVDPITLSDDELGRYWANLQFANEIERIKNETGNK